MPDVQEAALAVILRLLGVNDADLPAWRVQYRDLLSIGGAGRRPVVPRPVFVPTEHPLPAVEVRFV